MDMEFSLPELTGVVQASPGGVHFRFVRQTDGGTLAKGRYPSLGAGLENVLECAKGLVTNDPELSVCTTAAQFVAWCAHKGVVLPGGKKELEKYLADEASRASQPPLNN